MKALTICWEVNLVPVQPMKSSLSALLKSHGILKKNSDIIYTYNLNQMASKYLQKYPVPVGFNEVLTDLTR